MELTSNRKTTYYEITIVFLLALLILLGLLTQEQTITETVKMMEDQAPLPRVSIVIKGTQKGGINNAEAKITIPAAMSAILEFIFVGIKTEKYQIADEREITIQSVLA